MSVANPRERINYSGDLMPVFNDICYNYELGNLQASSLITTGYEDCNAVLETDHGKFLAKILSRDRSLQDVKRYVDIISQVFEAGINCPKPLRTQSGKMAYQRGSLSVIVQDFIEGQTFFEMERGPDAIERRQIVEQAAKINQLDYSPPYYDDAWAVTNLPKMLAKIRSFLSPEDDALLAQALERYNCIPFAQLPQAFVHGDIISTNVLKGDDGQIYILDFSVANKYPRVQELAVMASSLLSESSLAERCQTLVNDYDAFLPLTGVEKDNLHNYALAACAMELIGGFNARHFENNHTTENDYWIGLGRQVLKQELGLLS